MLWIWVGFIAFVLVLARSRPGGIPPPGPRGVHTRGLRLVGRVDRPRALLHPVRLPRLRGPVVGSGHHPGLADRSPESPEGRPNDGRSAVIKYLTGYVVEKSLSVDNIFVIAMIFSFFAVPPIYQHRVLVLGHPGRPRPARRDDRGRGPADRGLPLDPVRLRGLPDPHRDQDAVHDGAHRSQQSTDRARRPGAPSPSPTRFHGEHFFVRAGSPASYEGELPGSADRCGRAVVDEGPAGHAAC